MTPDYLENINIEYSWRKSISIQVLPDLTLRVKAPKLLSEKKVKEWIVQKESWIEKKRDYYLSFPERGIEKKYINGENHYFKGKKYLLKIEMGKKNWVGLEEGIIRVVTRKQEESFIEKLLDRWYREQAWDVFQDTLELQFSRFEEFNLPSPELKIRKMKSMWGSCSRKGIITLNLKLIQVPPRCLEYVVIHELCHLIEHNHGKNFYKLQERFFPQWKEMKKTLVKFHLMGD